MSQKGVPTTHGAQPFSPGKLSLGPASAIAEKQLVEKLRKFQRSELENKRCGDCGDVGPTYVCMDFGTFVCTTCSGLHREFNHKVKSVSMTRWTPQEVDWVLTRGNAVAKAEYLKHYKGDIVQPEPGKVTSLRHWLRYKYVDQRWREAPVLSPRVEQSPAQGSQGPAGEQAPVLLDSSAHTSPSKSPTKAHKHRPGKTKGAASQRHTSKGEDLLGIEAAARPAPTEEFADFATFPEGAVWPSSAAVQDGSPALSSFVGAGVGRPPADLSAVSGLQAAQPGITPPLISRDLWEAPAAENPEILAPQSLTVESPSPLGPPATTSGGLVSQVNAAAWLTGGMMQSAVPLSTSHPAHSGTTAAFLAAGHATPSSPTYGVPFGDIIGHSSPLTGVSNVISANAGAAGVIPHTRPLGLQTPNLSIPPPGGSQPPNLRAQADRSSELSHVQPSPNTVTAFQTPVSSPTSVSAYCQHMGQQLAQAVVSNQRYEGDPFAAIALDLALETPNDHRPVSGSPLSPSMTVPPLERFEPVSTKVDVLTEQLASLKLAMHTSQEPAASVTARSAPLSATKTIASRGNSEDYRVPVILGPNAPSEPARSNEIEFHEGNSSSVARPCVKVPSPFAAFAIPTSAEVTSRRLDSPVTNNAPECDLSFQDNNADNLVVSAVHPEAADEGAQLDGFAVARPGRDPFLSPREVIPVDDTASQPKLSDGWADFHTIPPFVQNSPWWGENPPSY